MFNTVLWKNQQKNEKKQNLEGTCQSVGSSKSKEQSVSKNINSRQFKEDKNSKWFIEFCNQMATMRDVLKVLHDSNQIIVGKVKDKKVEKTVDSFLTVWLWIK